MSTKAELEEANATLVTQLKNVSAENDGLRTEVAELQQTTREAVRDVELAGKRINRVALQTPTWADEQNIKTKPAPPAIWNVHLNSTDSLAPPMKVLDVALVADTVFLSIAAYDEDYDSKATTSVAEISVDIDALLDVLTILKRDELRANMRRVGEH